MLNSSVIILNCILRRSKLIWYLPLVYIVFLVSSRLSPVFIKDLQVSYILNIVFTVGVLSVLFISVMSFIWNIFYSSSDIKYELMLYRRMGLRIFLQSLQRVFLVIIFSLFSCFLFFLMIWEMNLRYILPVVLLSQVFVIFRLISLLLDLKVLYFLAIPVIAASLFTSFYLLPNVAYLLNGSRMYVMVYVLLYFILYSLLIYRILFHLWRNKCIGWIS